MNSYACKCPKAIPVDQLADILKRVSEDGGLSVPSYSGAWTASVYETFSDRLTVSRMFNAFDLELDHLCVTTAQRKEFLRTHPSWVSSKGTFFLSRVEGGYCVTCVTGDPYSPDTLSEEEIGYCEDDTWSGALRHRVVVPQHLSF